jgi:hypothetical protein
MTTGFAITCRNCGKPAHTFIQAAEGITVLFQCPHCGQRKQTPERRSFAEMVRCSLLNLLGDCAAKVKAQGRRGLKAILAAAMSRPKPDETRKLNIDLWPADLLTRKV